MLEKILGSGDSRIRSLVLAHGRLWRVCVGFDIDSSTGFANYCYRYDEAVLIVFASNQTTLRPSNAPT